MVNERAKQFSAFSPLKGYDALLKEKERIIVPEIELTEDRKHELNSMLSDIERGKIVKIIHYSEGEYISTTGVITNIDSCFKRLTIVKKEIDFKDIYDIFVEKDRIS